MPCHAFRSPLAHSHAVSASLAIQYYISLALYYLEIAAFDGLPCLLPSYAMVEISCGNTHSTFPSVQFQLMRTSGHLPAFVNPYSGGLFLRRYPAAIAGNPCKSGEIYLRLPMKFWGNGTVGFSWIVPIPYGNKIRQRLIPAPDIRHVFRISPT